jgi:ELP3 family radical SAM enzyme/protein acetyltransferase
VIDWTGIKKDYENGSHVPYGTGYKEGEENPLFELLISVKSKFPQYCRINRLVRDIPEGYILAGTSDTNGRQMIENLMKQRGLKCSCIRCREVKKKKIDVSSANLKVLKYRASGGYEYFLQYVTESDELIGFLRLRISDDAGLCNGKIAFQELVGCAMIRELHVYGQVVQVGQTRTDNSNSQQHAGFGTRLVQNAIYLAHTLGYNKISVISGEGVKPYYRRFGFYDGDHFMMKNIDPREFRNYHYVDRTSENITRRYHQLLLMATIIFVLIALYNCW